MDVDPKYLTLGTSYVGFLNAELRGLKGFGTMARELVQNADDAGGEDTPVATEIRFEITDEALIVWNDSIFSDCGQQQQSECPWKAERLHRCDFHRFRITAGSDKRGQEGTTGAFGIGFISVYQVTDRPEIRSNGQHWTVDPSETEDRRIRNAKDTEATSGTLLLLPWARDPLTPLRLALSLPPVTDSQINELSVELEQELTESLLFLKHVRKVVVQRNRDVLLVAERTAPDEEIILGRNGGISAWRYISADFNAEAAVLRMTHANQIEPKRKDDVTIVFPPDDLIGDGKLFVTLPTEQYTGLPLHINADFYPTPDRKRVLSSNDYQGDWNRAALSAAAAAVAHIVPELPKMLEPRLVWPFLNRIYESSTGSMPSSGGLMGINFWTQAAVSCRSSPVVYGIDVDWHWPSNVYLLRSEDDYGDRAALLLQIGIVVVHPSLRPFYNLLKYVGCLTLPWRMLLRILNRADWRRK